MDIEAAKRLVIKYEAIHQVVVTKILTAYRYYAGNNDIMMGKRKPCKDEEGANILRSADNRIPFHFHSLLVNQKASYLFTAPPLFDVGSTVDNQRIVDILGDAYAKKIKDLCIDASNAGIGWLHYWRDDKGQFQYTPIPAIQIYPVYSNDLNADISAVLRSYKTVDDNGEEWSIHEFWNETECAAYRTRKDIFEPFDMFSVTIEGLTKPTNVYRHQLGAVPFIPFRNNNLCTSDLDKIKHLCDAYDKTFSGFVDDLEDIQEVVLVLTNYGGTDPHKLLEDLKYYKAIALDSTGDGDKSGVSTLTIDIPVEARDKLLELTRKAIFDMGQGVDPQQQSFDKTSGEAMKFMYSLLELKAGMVETEFRLGFGELIRAICRLSGMAEPKQVIQTWTRTAIRNSAELADMCQKSVGIVSTKTILKNHPFVENADDEMKELKKEKAEQQAEAEQYQKAFGNQESADDEEKTGDVDAKPK